MVTNEAFDLFCLGRWQRGFQPVGVSLTIPGYTAPAERKKALSASTARRGRLWPRLGVDLGVELGDLGLQGFKLGALAGEEAGGGSGRRVRYRPAVSYLGIGQVPRGGLETAEEVITDFQEIFFQGLGWIPDLPPTTSQGILQIIYLVPRQPLRRCAGAVLRRGGIIADGCGCEQAGTAFSCSQIRHFLLVVRMDGGLAIGWAYRQGWGRPWVGDGADVDPVPDAGALPYLGAVVDEGGGVDGDGHGLSEL